VGFASSTAVYGNNSEGAAIDEDTAKALLTAYVANKLSSELYLDSYRRAHNLEPVVFRFSISLAHVRIRLHPTPGDQHCLGCNRGTQETAPAGGNPDRDVSRSADYACLRASSAFQARHAPDCLHSQWLYNSFFKTR